MRAGVTAGVSALWGTLSVPPPSSAVGVAANANPLPAVAHQIAVPPSTAPAITLSPAPKSRPAATENGTNHSSLSVPVSTSSFGSALAATTSAISFALSTPQSFPDATASSTSSNSLQTSGPSNSMLLSKLADIDLVRKGASSTLILKCGGYDVEPLFSSGLVKLTWYRIHKVQTDSDTDGSNVLDTNGESLPAHGSRSKYQPLDTRASAYTLSIDDIGCRILCVCRATPKGRLLIKATASTVVGIAEFQNEASNDSIEIDAKSKLSSGSAYFALEMEGRGGGKAQQADLSLTTDSATISSVSELGTPLVTTFRANTTTQVHIDTSNSDVFRFMVSSGDTKGKKEELSEVQEVWLRTHSSNARDLVVATLRLFCGQNFRYIPSTAELLDAPKEEREEDSVEESNAEQTTASLPTLAPTQSQHSHSVSSFGSAALAAFSLSTPSLSTATTSSLTPAPTTHVVPEVDVMHSQGRKPQLTMSQIVYVALMAPSPPPIPIQKSFVETSAGTPVQTPVLMENGPSTSSTTLLSSLSSQLSTSTIIQEEKEISVSITNNEKEISSSINDTVKEISANISDDGDSSGHNDSIQNIARDLSTKSTSLEITSQHSPTRTASGFPSLAPEATSKSVPVTSTNEHQEMLVPSSKVTSETVLLTSSLPSETIPSTSIVVESEISPAPTSVTSEQLRNTISSLQKDVADREKKISALEIAASVANRQNLERERAAASAFAEERKKTAAASSAQLSAAREETRRATDRILILEKELSALKTRLFDEASSHSLALSEANADKSRQVQAIKTELEAALLRGEASSRNEAAANSVAAKLRDESNEAKLEMSRAQEEARNLKVQLAAAALAAASSEAASLKSQEAVAEIERSANALRVERDDLRAAFSTKQAQSETLQQRAQIESEAAELRREVLKEREAVARQKSLADAAEAKTIELENNVTELKKMIERLDPRAFEEKITDLQKQLNAAKESEEAAVGEKNAAIKKYDSVRKDLQRLTAGESGDALKRISIDELKRAKDKLDVKLVKLSDENAALKEELEGLKLRKQNDQPQQKNMMVAQPAASSAIASAPVSSLPAGTSKPGMIIQPSSQGGGSGGYNNTMVSQLQVLINQLTSDVQEKDEQLQQQKAIKDSLASSLREQATRIADLEKRLGEKSW